VTTPVAEPTVAIEVDAELQVPPGVASVNVVVNTGHTDVVPVIDPGIALMVTVVVAEQLAPRE
jgi:hypothetical protein